MKPEIIPAGKERERHLARRRIVFYATNREQARGLSGVIRKIEALGHIVAVYR